MMDFNKEFAKIEVMELLGFNMEDERKELKEALIASIAGTPQKEEK